MSARETWLLFGAALALRAAAFRPGLPPAPPEALLVGSEPGALLFTVRLASALAGSLAVVLSARAGGRLGGRLGGLAAGTLLALTPLAIRHAGWLGPPGVLILAASGGLLQLLRWIDERRPADLAGLAAWTALAWLGLRWAPLTNIAPGGVVSPLAEGIRQAAGIAGPVTLALGILGFVAAVRSPGGARAVAGVTGASLLVVLLREGPDPNSLAVIVPGVILLAALAAARPAAIFSALPSHAGRIALAVAVLFALVGAVRAVALSRGASPARDVERWALRNLPEALPVLVDDPDVELPVQSPGGAKGFFPVLLPSRGIPPAEAAVCYDLPLALLFPAMILREPPASADPVRAGFHAYVSREWHAAFRTGEGEYPLTPLTVFARPEGWEPDSAEVTKIASRVERDGRAALRDSSTAFTRWVVAAGRAMRSGGDLGRAEQFLDAALDRDAGGAGLLFERGLTHLLRGENDRAKSVLLQALSADPHHGGAHYNLGTLLEDEGDLNGAETEYRAATLYLDDPTPAHARLGALLVRTGRTDEARGELDRIRRLHPGGEAQRFLESVIAGAASGGL